MNTPCVVNFDNLYPNRVKIIQIAAGFRSTFFFTENRQILSCGTNGSQTKANLCVKFDLKVNVYKF